MNALLLSAALCLISEDNNNLVTDYRNSFILLTKYKRIFK